MKYLPSKKIKSILTLLLVFLFVNNCSSVTNSDYEPKNSIVKRYGQLSVKGNQIVDKDGNPIVLRGMSLFWSQWMGQYYNYDCVKWLRDDWRCTVVRAAMGVEMGGYLSNPEIEMKKIKTVIDACIDLGIYVIVDWHDHNAERNIEKVVIFFREIAETYGNKPNIIYEIYNEPLRVSWDKVVKPYSEVLIENIREFDSKNLILVGTPTWSQDVDVAALNPINYSNIAYTMHFYAATHKQSLRNKTKLALDRGAAIFVSEFGTCEASGTGIIDYNELETWFSFMETNMLSWCNWSIADKNETSAALKPGTNAKGGWTDNDLTTSGKLIREKIRSLNEVLFKEVEK